MKIYLLSAFRTLLFFVTMMIGSVLLQQALYGQDPAITEQLGLLLVGGVVIATPLYALFDVLATRIRQSSVWWSLFIPIAVGLIVGLFFAYSAYRLAAGS